MQKAGQLEKFHKGMLLHLLGIHCKTGWLKVLSETER